MELVQRNFDLPFAHLKCNSAQERVDARRGSASALTRSCVCRFIRCVGKWARTRPHFLSTLH